MKLDKIMNVLNNRGIPANWIEVRVNPTLVKKGIRVPTDYNGMYTPMEVLELHSELRRLAFKYNVRFESRGHHTAAWFIE